MVAWLGGLALAASVVGVPHQGVRPFEQGNRYIEGFIGRSIPEFLGSEDHRRVRGIGIGTYLEGPRRLRYRNYVPELVVTGYYHRSTSPGVSGVGPNGSDAYGVLALARYAFLKSKGFSCYFDLGMGVQYSDMRTVDLSGRLSTTPTLGFGFAFGPDHTQSLLGLRLLHISNAGLQGNNQGQNQLLITLGIRF